jgi:hypothetical protein
MTLAADNFRHDWYGHLTNQLGHMVLGLAVVAGWCAIGAAWHGEFPAKVVMACTVAAAYLAFELAQGGRLADSIEDTVFVLWGAGLCLIVFDWYQGWVFTGDLSRLHPWVWICIAQLTLGCVLRYISGRRLGNDG